MDRKKALRPALLSASLLAACGAGPRSAVPGGQGVGRRSGAKRMGLFWAPPQKTPFWQRRMFP